MQRRLKITLISAAAALGLVGATAGLSAATSGSFEYAGYGGKHRGIHMVCAQGEERLEDIVTFAEIRLSITDAQQAEWDTFAAAVQTGGKQMLTACDRMETLRTGTAPERMAEIEEIMETALGATRTIRASFDPLYAVLTDEQKATVERLTKHRGGHRGHSKDQKDG
ncbi:Spy/CpxP family protein refolding chaperone [Minwuia sp.]|uniref:Spy/CpxP family protein refolding chaperone n=1 Tax=Minwuia sp. TaxID=2493630 RepID=UPI003A938B94